MLSSLLDNLSTETLGWTVAMFAAFAGAVVDTLKRKLPNVLTVPVWVFGLAFALGAGGMPAFWGAMAASAICAVPFIVLFVFASGGAGDAKMMAAVGAWVGLGYAVPVLLGVVLSGMVLAIAYSFARREGWIVLHRFVELVSRLGAVAGGGAPVTTVRDAFPTSSTLSRFPYGCAIFAGVTLAAIGAQLWHV